MEDRKIIGIGKTATVYEWEDSKILKLFNMDYPKESIDKEFKNAKAIESLSFAKPKAYELMFYEGQRGILYSRVKGEDLLAWVLRTNNVEACAVYMARLHKSILSNSVDGLPSYKEFLKHNIEKAASVNLRKREEALKLLDKLPDGDTLCHGDFHPGNILMSEEPTVIDFMNLCQGHYLYDVARTVFLIEYTPVPLEFSDKEMLLKLKKSLSDLYLGQMEVTREMIKDYLSIIAVARVGECPEE